jgi:hypothetical protein
LANPLKNLMAGAGGLAVLGVVAAAAAGPERLGNACVSVGFCKAEDVTGALLAAVQKQNRLTIFAARLVEAVTSTREVRLLPGGIGPVVETVRLTSIVPAEVTYSVDLSGLTAADLGWDAATSTLTVRRPPVQVGAPSVRWDKAQHYSDGSFIADLNKADAGLLADNQRSAPKSFQRLATAPDLIVMADRAADEALATSLRLPLVAVGYANAKVVVLKRVN